MSRAEDRKRFLEAAQRHSARLLAARPRSFLGHVVIEGKSRTGHRYACVEPIFTPGHNLTEAELAFLRTLVAGSRLVDA